MPHRPPSHRPSFFVDQDVRCTHAWQLPKGRAASLRPSVDGVLRVTQGRVWATRDVHPGSAVADLGDHMLGPDDTLVLRAGQGAVIESWPQDGAASVSIMWAPALHAPLATRWQAAVVAPAQDLGRALAQALQAAVRLLAGLAGYTEFLTAGRGKVLSRLESNAP